VSGQVNAKVEERKEGPGLLTAWRDATKRNPRINYGGEVSPKSRENDGAKPRKGGGQARGGRSSVKRETGGNAAKPLMRIIGAQLRKGKGVDMK